MCMCGWEKKKRRKHIKLFSLCYETLVWIWRCICWTPIMHTRVDLFVKTIKNSLISCKLFSLLHTHVFHSISVFFIPQILCGSLFETIRLTMYSSNSSINNKVNAIHSHRDFCSCEIDTSARMNINTLYGI